MANLVCTNRTTTSLTCQVLGQFPSDWALGVNWYLNSEYVGYCGASSDADTEWTFDGLSPGTTYEVKFVAWGANDYRPEPAVSANLTTLSESPNKWEWTSDVSEKSAMEFEITEDGVCIVKPLTAAEWNGFIDHIFEIAAYKGVSLDGSSEDYHVREGSEMLASEANAARTLISALSPTTSLPAAVVSTKSEITAAFIIGLKDSLNSIE